MAETKYRTIVDAIAEANRRLAELQEIREALVPILAEMIAAAATWTDAPLPLRDPTEAGGGK